MGKIIRKYWFFAGLFFVFLITICDKTETVSKAGKWLKIHHGPDCAVIVIFFFSGLILNTKVIKSGLMDVKGILIALGVVFIIAPLAAAVLSFVPLSRGIMLGIFVVAVVPTTLSSGVVMTGTAGGNVAHALVITILSSGMSVFSIPFVLSLLLNFAGESVVVSINKPAIMLKIGLVVLVPLCIGLVVKFYVESFLKNLDKGIQAVNQCLILCVVWMALSQGRNAIVQSGKMIGVVFLVVFIFHGIMLIAGFVLSIYFKLQKGRRESVILMGGQKTLPLSLMLQVSLFPQYGLALVVCVMHHIVHLIMDGYVIAKLKTSL